MPVYPSFDQKSNLMTFSGILNLLRLMMRSSNSMIGLTGSSGSIVILPLFDEPASVISTVSTSPLTVLLFLYTLRQLHHSGRVVTTKIGIETGRKTHHDLLGVVWTHPLPTGIRHARHWRVETIKMPR